MEGRVVGGGDQQVQLIEEEEEEGSGISSCPSFNSYSSRRLPVEGSARDRLVKEFDEDDFEFVPVIGDHAGCDDRFIINSDWIGPVFPVFNRDLLLDNGAGGGGESGSSSIMVPLRDLFMEEEENQQSSSSEADDDLEGIPQGTYCVWTPRGKVGGQPAPSRECRKSNSTGSRSLRRWRFLDMVRRSNSDRKDSLVFLTPSESPSATRSEASTTAGISAMASGSGTEVMYKRKKVVVVVAKEGGKRRKSYFPYRKDVVGFLANVSSFGTGRIFPPLG